MSDTFENMGVSSCSFWFMNWVVLAPAMLFAASMKNINRTLNPQPGGWETGFFSGLLIPSWLQFLTIVKVKPSAVSPLENSADVKTTRLDISWWVLYLEYLEVAFCILRVYHTSIYRCQWWTKYHAMNCVFITMWPSEKEMVQMKPERDHCQQ